MTIQPDQIEVHGGPEGAEPWIVWGKGGWVAGKLTELLKDQGKTVIVVGVRMHHYEDVREVLEQYKTKRVLCAAGFTGRPNIDQCEESDDMKNKTVEANVTGPMVLAGACKELGVHLTVFATGCIYHFKYADQKSMLGPVTNKPFTEEDPPNFDGSYYSKTKTYLEGMLRDYPNVMVLRVRMPVSDDLHPRSFVTKIAKYDRLVNIPNSNTILYDLLPPAVEAAERKVTGVFNFTNPGAISHNEVMQLLKEYVKPELQWQNFTDDPDADHGAQLVAQAGVINAGRSNCELDSSKFCNMVREWGFDVPEVHEGYRRCFQRMAAAEGGAQGKV